MALATVEQLRVRLQNPSFDGVLAQQLLDEASALVEQVAGRRFGFVSQETVLLSGGQRDLMLPESPIVVNGGNPLAVQELLSGSGPGGALAEGVGFVRVGERLIRMSGNVAWPRLASPRPAWAPWVNVTYSHGYATDAIPPWLSSIVLDAAVTLAAFDPAVGTVQSRTVGRITETYFTGSDAGSASLLDAVEAKLVTAGALRRGAWTIGAL